MTQRLALGTVQFGLPYGIANRGGQVEPQAAAAILKLAWDAGVDTLDTAIAYGTSEERLGEIGVGQWRVISKLPPIPPSCPDVHGWAQDTVRASLQRLGISKLAGLLLHRPMQLLEADGAALYRSLLLQREQGVCDMIGVSIYGPEELDQLCPRFRFDLVQAPFSVIDRRLTESGWLQRLRAAGTEVHVRSVFLQGLLLMERGRRPAYFDAWAPLWRRWEEWLRAEQLSALHGALRYVLSIPEIDRIVIGVDSPRHLQEILAVGAAPEPLPPRAAPDVRCADAGLINPSAWKTS